jgi:hypothetical protein
MRNLVHLTTSLVVPKNGKSLSFMMVDFNILMNSGFGTNCASQLFWRNTPKYINVHLREYTLVYQFKVEELDLLDLRFAIAHDLDPGVIGLI